jgi:hypothetical protein
MGATDKQYLYSSASDAGKAGGDSFSGPLPPTVRHQFEGQFGTDLSSVTVHVGHAATLLGAEAYTAGTDIHFAPSAYRPFSSEGQELLGHEIAHVVQQGSAAPTAEQSGE